MATPEDFKLNPKQKEQFALIKSDAKYILGLGGSRSGKTFGFMTAIYMRAFMAPGSRHGVFRSTIKDSRETLFGLTFPAMAKAVDPDLWKKCEVNKSELTITLPNESVILFSGLDDDGRMESILGQEYLTLYCNEVSQIKNFKPVSMFMTRLSQKCVGADGRIPRPKFFFDCNPSSTKHWAYKAFIEKVQPENGTPWKRPEDWAWIQMNPIDNLMNLNDDYMDLMDNMSARDKQRFIEGKWQTEVDGALFKVEWIDDTRLEELKGDLVRIIVAVDPAISNNPGSDETGIIVAGIDAQGHGYVLADYSTKGTPETWAKAVARAYEDWKADLVVYEANQGGLMVETTLRSSGCNLPMKAVHASRGKVIRAEPISTLYEQGKVSHVGTFGILEDQMANFTIDFNRARQGSPDRLDALVWALSELMTEKIHVPGKAIVGKARGLFA